MKRWAIDEFISNTEFKRRMAEEHNAKYDKPPVEGPREPRVVIKGDMSPSQRALLLACIPAMIQG